jgi:small subunit ribosomal protein S15
MALTKETKQILIRDFARDAKDTGSVELQVALLTKDIQLLTEHLKLNKNDFSCKRGLLIKVARRKSFLDYLAKNDAKKYQDVVTRLGLKR